MKEGRKISLFQLNADERYEEDFMQLQENAELTSIIKNYQKENRRGLINYCRERGLFIIHRLIEHSKDVSELTFLKEDEGFYKDNHLRDLEERTWLHSAIKSNRSIDILKYLVEELHVDIAAKDMYVYSSVHFVCHKEHFVEEELEYFITTQDCLLDRTLNEITALEFACGDEQKLHFIRKTDRVSILFLMENIDCLDCGLPENIQPFAVNSRNNQWLSILKKDESSRLLNWIKTDKSFSGKYFLDSKLSKSILMQCPDNGLGILQFIRQKFLIKEYKKGGWKITKVFSMFDRLIKSRMRWFYIRNKEKTKNEIIFEYLTRIKVNRKSDNNAFYNSSLFLALIIGQTNLTKLLLRCCRFEILPFAMLTCLMCKKIGQIEKFSVDTKLKIKEMKEFCEGYAIEVISRTLNRDQTRDKKVVTTYLMKKLNTLEDHSVLFVAYKAECKKFLSLPICQQALTDMWHGKVTESATEFHPTKWKTIRNRLTCPLVKYCLHSIFHLLFLITFSIGLTDAFIIADGFIIVFCATYVIGYLIEELRQIYFNKESFTFYLKDETNVLDIGALIFIALGFISMMIFNSIDSSRNIINFRYHLEGHYSIRVLFCFSLIFFYMRLLYFASISEKIGPCLKMISTMIVQDLLPFIFIFVIFLFSFGVVFQSLLFRPGHSNVDLDRRTDIIGNIIRRPAFSIFDGDYLLSEVEEYLKGNEYQLVITYFFLVVFLVVTNIMLLNLLIALFSYTVTAIIRDAQESWRASWYNVVKEYSDRTLLPPPFNILNIFLELLYYYINEKKKNHTMAINKMFSTCLSVTKYDNEYHLIPSEKESVFFNFSFYILQAFAIKGCRYQLLSSEKDEQNKLASEIKLLKSIINQEIKHIRKKLKGFQDATEKQVNSLKVDLKNVVQLLSKNKPRP